MDSVKFKVQLAQFAIMHDAPHLKKKMVVQTPRLHTEEMVSGIFRHEISRGDQEKIMQNFQGF